MHSQKRVSGNQSLSTVSEHLLLGLPLKIYRTQLILLQYLNPSWISGTDDGFRS